CPHLVKGAHRGERDALRCWYWPGRSAWPVSMQGRREHFGTAGRRASRCSSHVGKRAEFPVVRRYAVLHEGGSLGLRCEGRPRRGRGLTPTRLSLSRPTSAFLG